MKFHFPELNDVQKVHKKISEMAEICSEMGWDIPEDIGYDFTVKFDIESVRLAGQACWRPSSEYCFVRFHPKALKYYGFEKYKNTVIHEYAHIITYINFPAAKAHGREFKAIFKALGGNGQRCHSYDLRKVMGKEKRKVKRIPYKCGCRIHNITLNRVTKINKGATYVCLDCNVKLTKVR